MNDERRRDRPHGAPGSTPGSIRAFVAVQPPDAVRDLLARTVREIRGNTIAVKWVEPENLHLTLAFLGGITPAVLESAVLALERAASGEPVFSAHLQELGAFPNLRRPRVIWAGLTGAPELARLAGKVREELGTAGVYFDDKPFTAHFTLGRLREGIIAPSEILQRLASARVASEPFEIGCVHLMKSQLTPSGPIYHSLRVIRLGGT